MQKIPVIIRPTILIDKAVSICVFEDDKEDIILQKKFLTYQTFMMCVGGILWGAACLIFNREWQAIIPFGYVVFSTGNIITFHYHRDFNIAKSIQSGISLLLPFLLQICLGGFIASGAVMLWALLALTVSVTYQSKRSVVLWFSLYAVLTIILGIFDNVFIDWIKPYDALPYSVIFTVSNIIIISAILVWLFNFMVRGKNDALRKLSMAQSQLVQSEKMATLGTLAAGVAHELNNPAAAVRRASKQLDEVNRRLEITRQKLNSMNLSTEELNCCKLLADIKIKKHTRENNAVDVMKHSDSESVIEEWLDEKGINEPWVIAPVLNDYGVLVDELKELEGKIKPLAFETVLYWISDTILSNSLLFEIMEGSSRISEIVVAMKSYSYLGQAPIQQINIHEGIDNTLVILRNKLKQGITIKKFYGKDIPVITAYGSELNQVWTNILDNAIDVLKDKGEICISTRKNGSSIIVEIEDNGPGMTPEVQKRIFDPFFTTKAPGKGTGLGLSTSYGIVTEKHHGKLSVQSKNGMTRFTIVLPIKQ